MDSNTPLWPTSLALPQHMAAVQCKARNAVTEMETGRKRIRRTFQDIKEAYSVRWSFVQSEYSTFLDFYETELDNGSLSFVLTIYGVEREFVFANGQYSFQKLDNAVLVSSVLFLLD